MYVTLTESNPQAESMTVQGKDVVTSITHTHTHTPPPIEDEEHIRRVPEAGRLLETSVTDWEGSACLQHVT